MGDGAAVRPPFALELLPVALVTAVLPADARARCACVCRAWRLALAHPAYWGELDLTRAGGVTCACINPSVVLAALAARLEPLRVLRVEAVVARGRHAHGLDHALGGVLDLVHSGRAPALCQLHVAGAAELDERGAAGRTLRALLVVGHALAVELEELECSGGDAGSLLALPRLRVRHVHWLGLRDAALFGALAGHDSLQALTLQSVGAVEGGDPALARVLDLVLERRLVALRVDNLRLAADSAPHLARLLRDGGWLRRLSLQFAAPLDAASRAALADALRANATLRELRLVCAGLWHGGASDVCAALEGHPSLACFASFESDLPHAAAMDEALARLLAANAAALTSLKLEVDVPHTSAPGLPRLFAALADNRQLRSLEVRGVAGDAPFLRDELLRGVRANASLRDLCVRCGPSTLHEDARAALQDAHALVAARTAAGALPAL